MLSTRKLLIIYPGFLVALFASINGCSVLNTTTQESTLSTLRDKADAGNTQSQLELAAVLRNGVILPKDESRSLHYLNLAAASHSAQGLYLSGQYYQSGIGTEIDLPKARARYQSAALLGHAQAQTSLADLLLEGLLGERDASGAYKWYLSAANQNHREAQFKLGSLYSEGLGVAPDATAAAFWFRKSADQGHPQAQLRLGDIYFHGIGIDEDIDAAASWYERSAKQGSVRAQSHLGDLLSRDSFLSISNLDDGIKWYQLAAAQGHAHAQYRLGVLLSDGARQTDRTTEALTWLRRAAHQGYAAAQCNLGARYYNGTGVKQDLTQAKIWFDRATSLKSVGITPLIGFIHYKCDQFEVDTRTRSNFSYAG